MDHPNASGPVGPGAEADRIAAVASLGLLDTPPEERFDRITRFASQLFGVPMAAVSLVATDRQWFKSAQGLAVSGTARQDAFCSTTITDTRTFVVEDAATDDRFADNPLVTGDPNIRFYAGHPLSGPGGHRVGALCIMDRRPRHLTDEELRLLADLAVLVEKEMAVDEELDRAAAVQQALLPKAPPVVEGWEVAGCCITDRNVGGDFFDWYPSVDGTVAVTLADVMGKGMAAALVMATVRAVLRAGATNPDLSGALAGASAALDSDLTSTAAFVTAFCARLHPASGRVDYVDAGHGLAFVSDSDGRLTRLGAGGPPLGALPDTTWDAGRADLQPGEVLFVCSDGVLDAFGANHGAVAAIADLVDPRQPVGTAARQLAETAAHRRPGDDVTVVMARRL